MINTKIKKERKALVLRDECVACGQCVKDCPRDAISIHRGVYAVIDKEICIGCAKCSKSCPASVIQMEVQG